ALRHPPLKCCAIHVTKFIPGCSLPVPEAHALATCDHLRTIIPEPRDDRAADAAPAAIPMASLSPLTIMLMTSLGGCFAISTRFAIYQKKFGPKI
ncbi:hypothetical protein, partial [Allomesorhizobium camelthorni]|uniref:hypothetical protein n=1 Tax=Allomesorhizobium camelthorni TaxID=475069 RepID=UPI00197FE029